MQPANLLFIMSDEHNKRVLGSHGHPMIQTPNLDRLAARGTHKYIHYVELPPMLFDLEADPYERADLGRDPAYQQLIAECEAALRKVVDPEAVDKLAKADQQAHIKKHGGKDAILKRGTFRYSPPPGAKASYY